MSNELVNQESPVSVPSKRIPIRGATISKEDLRRILDRLQTEVLGFGKLEVGNLKKPDETPDAEWCLTSALPNVIEIAAYFYVFFVSLFAYRGLFGYAKWLFPSMELIGSNPSIAKNRGVLKWLVGGLILAGTAKFFFG